MPYTFTRGRLLGPQYDRHRRSGQLAQFAPFAERRVSGSREQLSRVLNAPGPGAPGTTRASMPAPPAGGAALPMPGMSAHMPPLRPAGPGPQAGGLLAILQGPGPAPGPAPISDVLRLATAGLSPEVAEMVRKVTIGRQRRGGLSSALTSPGGFESGFGFEAGGHGL